MRETVDKAFIGNEAKDIEFLEFSVGSSTLGIGISNIRELLQYQPVKPMPSTHRYQEGVICPRGEILAVFDLAAYLGENASLDLSHDIFIVAEYDNKPMAFHVHSVIGIRRVAAEIVQMSNTTALNNDNGVIDGFVQIENRIIAIVDFKKILTDTGFYSAQSEKHR